MRRSTLRKKYLLYPSHLPLSTNEWMASSLFPALSYRCRPPNQRPSRRVPQRRPGHALAIQRAGRAPADSILELQPPGPQIAGGA